ncbi:MAG UNVERIFIED_CONTAM: hypothetical protein LVR18_24865 [Planctomycetaceae bacterium]|jgi:hypothetical protein
MELFYDAGQKTFFFTSNDHEKLFARTSSVYDSAPLPSGNSVAAAEFAGAGVSRSRIGTGVAAEEMLRRVQRHDDSVTGQLCWLGLALQQHLGAGGVEGGAGRDWWVAPGRTGCGRAGTVVPVSLGLWQSASDEKSGAQAAGKSDEKKKETRPIKAKIYPFYNKLPRGGKCPVAIELTVAEGWHVNANPASEDYLIPTEVKVSSCEEGSADAGEVS